MENETLLQHIEQAREELLAVHNLGPEDRELVGRLMNDVITHVTKHGSTMGEEQKQVRENLSDQIKQEIVRLEAEHPRLAGMLDRLTNMISSLGI